MRTAVLPAALAVCVGLGGVGCGGDSEPASTETAPLLSTSSGTPSPSPPAEVVGGKDDIGGSVSADLDKEPKVVVPAGKPPGRLLTEDIVKGDGEIASQTSAVTVRYVAMYYDTGEMFDSSWEREDKKDTFALSGVIVGFAQGVAGMREGGRRAIAVPHTLAYGAKGSDNVPPKQSLLFIVDLLEVA